MRRFTTGLLALTLAIALTSNAQAGLLGSVITFDGVEDQLQDNSVAGLIADNGTVGSLDAGDILFGIVRIQKNLSPTPDLDISPSLGELDLVFAAEVTSGPLSLNPGSFPGQSLGFTLAPTVASQAALAGALSSFGALPAGVIGAILSSPASSSPVDPTGQVQATALANLNSGIWMLDATIGFDTSVGGANVHGGTDFFQAKLLDNNGDGAITFATEWTALAGLSAIGSEAGGFSVLSQPGLSGTAFLAVGASALFPSPIGPATLHDVAIRSGQLLTPGSSTPAGFVFADQATFAMNAVPEPTSLTLFGLGLLGMGLVGYRRRKDAA